MDPLVQSYRRIWLHTVKISWPFACYYTVTLADTVQEQEEENLSDEREILITVVNCVIMKT